MTKVNSKTIPAANRHRIIEEFKELTGIDSESLEERQIADRLKDKLIAAGCTVEEDDAAEKVGGSCGNLFARLDGKGDPVLFSAHMDTVSPGKGKEARISDGVITGNGIAVLGADDVTGIVEILEGIRILTENNIEHRPAEILFTVSEETFAMGVNAFDISNVKAKEAYVLDLEGPVGSAAVRAPSLIMFRIRIKGKAAHAGFAPEEGINAIEAASKAVASIKQGRIEDDTTVNIGKIEGGNVTNIVPDLCRITGEVRSLEHEKAEKTVAEILETFRREAVEAGAEIETKTDVLIRAYKVDEESKVCRNFLRAIEGFEGSGSPFITTFGGSDNNILAARGIEGIVLSSGMYNAHSLEEYTTVSDLEKGAGLVAALCAL